MGSGVIRKAMMKLVVTLLALLSLACAPAWAGPPAPPDVVPSASMPASPTAAPDQAATPPDMLPPAAFSEALAEGRSLAGVPALYRDGLGVYRPCRFEYVFERPANSEERRYGAGPAVKDSRETVGYVFVGTKYNLIKARAASAARKKSQVPKAYVDKALAARALPVAFYVREFDPGLMLLVQDGLVIKGEEGWAGLDPGVGFSKMTKSFPYDEIDFTKPLKVVVYDLDGNTYTFDVDLGAHG